MADAQEQDWQPVGAPVAPNDDWAPIGQQQPSYLDRVKTAYSTSVLHASLTGAKENFDLPGLDTEMGRLDDMLRANPFFGNGIVRQTTEAAAAAFGITMRVPGAIMAGASAGAGQAYENLGGNAAWGARLTRDLNQMLQVSGAVIPEGATPKLASEPLKSAVLPIVKEFQDTITTPGIEKGLAEAAEKPPAPTAEGQPANPLQSLYDHLSKVDEAKQLGVVGEEVKPEPTLKDSPAQLAEEAVPQPVNAAIPPPELRGNFGHEPGTYDVRGKEWIDKIDAPDDVRDVIEKIATDHDYFPESRAGAPSPASRAAVAEAAGIDPKEMNSEYFASHFDSDGKVRAVIQTLRQTAQDFMKAAETARKEPTVENIAAATEAQMRHTHVVEYTLGLRAESGRTLNAWKDLLRETERTKATVKLKAGEQTGEVPTGATDLVNAAGEIQSNIKAGKDKIGIQKLIDAAERLVAPEKVAPEDQPKLAVPPELASLVDEAKKALTGLKGEKTPAQFQKLIDAAERQAVNMGKQKTVKNPVEALPPELQVLVDKAERIVDRFGGVARGERAALLLARTGRTAAEQEALARSVADLTPNQVAKVLDKLRTSPEARKPGWFYWAWMQGLISGLITHTKYLAVNTATTVLERTIAPEVAALIGKARGEKVSAMAPLYSNVAMLRALPDAFSAAGTAFKTGMRVPLESEMRLFERGEESPQVKGAAAAYAPPGPEWGIWKKVFNEDQLDTAAKVLGIPGRSANMIHTFYKVLSERASAGMRAYEAAFQEGATGEHFWERYQHHLNNPTDDALRGAVTDAYTGAFMAKLGEKTEKWAAALKQNPIMKWVFPFQHIPWNIERMSIEYSPLAILGPEMRAAILGRKGAPAQNLAIAKMAVGSSIIGYFIHKTLAGESTGDYPSDPKERKDWALQGKQPNSSKMDGQWVSRERFGPVGNLANIGANLASIIQHYNGQDDDALTKALWASTMAAANQIGNEVGFQTLRNFIDAIEDPKKAQRFVAWQAGSFMPASSFLSQNASIIDPYMRKADDLVSGLKYRIPLLRETLPVKRDPLYGEPVPNPGYHTVFRSAPSRADAVKLEMARLDYHPGAPVNRVGGLKLTPEMYDEYEATAGPLVKQMLQSYVSQPAYQSLPDSVKAREFHAIVSTGRAQARLAIMAHHPELMQQGIEARKTAIFGKP